jgi:HEAT repeat protein
MRHNWLAGMVFSAARFTMPLTMSLAMLLTAALATAQAPKVLNTQFHTEPAGSGLTATVNRFRNGGGPLWFGYEVATRPHSHFSVCSSGSSESAEDECCGVYRLEETDSTWRATHDGQATITYVDVLVRMNQGEVSKVVFINKGCQIDAAGVPFTWITDVKAEDSVAWLSSLIGEENKRRTEEAFAAIAMHETEKATAALVKFSSSNQPLWLREKASFWLGAERGHDGLLALEKMMDDSDPEFRKKIVFDLFISHEPTAIDDMIRMAKSDPNTGVREQGIFWVGQKAGAKAVATLKDAVKNDPELGVKKKAVFALSQLPKDEAVPELLRVAETNTSPELRKEAIFWLGQTRDPRALAYFEKVLER